MQVEEVKRLSVEERFIYWIKERESIRIKKEKGLPKPWTDDRIFQTYKFTCVRRMNDKVSQWLLKNWYQPNYNHPNMLLNVVLGRLFNKPSTLEHIGFQTKWDPNVRYRLKEYRDSGNTVFNGAYIVSTNGLSGDKIDVLFDHLIEPLVNNLPKLDTDSVERSVSKLCGYWGLSTFLAGQIVADLVFATKGTWSDKCTWAAIGPGSRRGMNRFLSKPVDSGMTQGMFNDHLTKAITLLRTKLPHIMKGLHAIDVQSCFCEFDKYERCLHKEGTPKQRYQGV